MRRLRGDVPLQIPMSVLSWRIAHLPPDHFDERMPDLLVERLRLTSWRLEPLIAIGVLRSVCNGWCTTRRYGQPVAMCKFSSEVDGDDMVHYL
eukprot:942813-Alexandrium_andersonii.AAC.1